MNAVCICPQTATATMGMTGNEHFAAKNFNEAHQA